MRPQFNPVFEYHSDRSVITLQLNDDYQVRNDILAHLHRNATAWFDFALARAPIELQSTLQARCTLKYFVHFDPDMLV